MTEAPFDSESTKQRALRIPLQHAAQPDGLLRTKWFLAILATFATLLYTVWICWAAPEPNLAFSPGPVADVHAAWNTQCSACHPAFTPIRSDALFANVPAHRQAVESKCQSCHATATHHASISANEASCTSCHQEHQGGSASLLRMADSHCVGCHANLQAVNEHTKKSDFHAHLTSFYDPNAKVVADARMSAKETREANWPHPRFRSIENDPGNIKFNHGIHMTAGLPGTEKNGKPLMSYQQLHAASPQAFRTLLPNKADRASDAAPLQLECNSCHQAAGADGAYMQPISFEQHCRACHPLNLTENPSALVPHGLPPADLKAAVMGLLIGERSEPLPASTQEHLQQKLLGKPDPLIAAKEASLADQILQVEATLTNARCKKCHEFQQQGRAFSAPVEPSNLPTVWLKHAKFNHAAHRMMGCVDCHPGTTPEGRSERDPRGDDQRVMIANYDTCVECHRPTNSAPPGFTNHDLPPFKRLVGARSDCVECHSYHGGEHAGTPPETNKQP